MMTRLKPQGGASTQTATPLLPRSGGLVLLSPAEHATQVQHAVQTAFQTPGSALFHTAQQDLNLRLRIKEIDPQTLSPRLKGFYHGLPTPIQSNRLEYTPEPNPAQFQLITLTHTEARGTLTPESRYLYKKAFQQVERTVRKYLKEKQLVCFSRKSIRGKESLLQYLQQPGQFTRLNNYQERVQQYPAAETLSALGRLKLLGIPEWKS
jgi:hypothetical protein